MAASLNFVPAPGLGLAGLSQQQYGQQATSIYPVSAPGQVQWSLEPYYAQGSSESKSVVLRSNPQDYFRPYSQYLSQLFGKFNPGLRHPTDPNVRLPGWIFSAKQEPQVRALVNQIVSGQIAPAAVSNPLPLQGQPNSFSMTSIPGFQSSTPNQPMLVPIRAVEGQVQPRMQTITTIKPGVGETLYLVVEGQRYPIVIQDVETAGPFVIGATFKMGDTISKIELNKSFDWQVPSYNTPHKIEL